MLDNLIMRSIINVHNDGSSQIEADGYTFVQLEQARFEVMERGYDCQIVEEFKKLQFIVTRRKN